jgi:hypothetical protein
MAYHPNPQLVNIIKRIGGDLADELLTTALIESGGQLHPGNIDGPYQMTSSGRGHNTTPAQRSDPLFSTESALAEFRRFQAGGAVGADLAYKSQRPADEAGYKAKYNRTHDEALKILGMAPDGPAARAAGTAGPNLAGATKEQIQALIGKAPSIGAAMVGAIQGNGDANALMNATVGHFKAKREYAAQEAAAAKALQSRGTPAPADDSATLGGQPGGFKPGGGPADHKARPLGNWQSDNAYDIMGSDHQEVFIPIAGKVTKISGKPGQGGGLTGYGITISTPQGNLFFKHFATANVKVGQTVQPGTFLGTLDPTVNGGSHIHLGSDNDSLLGQLYKYYIGG